jgi:hypothetical protein
MHRTTIVRFQMKILQFFLACVELRFALRHCFKLPLQRLGFCSNEPYKITLLQEPSLFFEVLADLLPWFRIYLRQPN